MKRFLIMVAAALIVIGCRKYGRPPMDTTKKWIVTTIAGNGMATFADGAAGQSSFRAPIDIAVAGDGIIYVADAINHRIRTIAGGQVSTFAGSGVEDTVGGTGTNAGFALPAYLSFDSNGDLYVLDVKDPRVRKISPAGLVSVAAGKTEKGFADGDADTARFGDECSGIAADGNGNIFVMDWRNRRLRKIGTDGKVTTLAGNGNQVLVNGMGDQASFFDPAGLAIDNQGNIFAGDQYQVRKIAPDGTVTTFAGKNAPGYQDGPAGEAQFTQIEDLVIDEQQNIYLTDGNRIRKITPQGMVSTIAGSTGGFKDGPGSVAQFLNPVGLGIDKNGNIYVADDHNNRVRKISFQ